MRARASSALGPLGALAFFLLEAVQGVLLLPWLSSQLGGVATAGWILLSSGAPLVGLSLAAQYQHLVKGLAALQSHDPGLPHGWKAVRQSWAMHCTLGLLILQACFVGGLAVMTPVGVHPWHVIGQAPMLAYLLGQHLRLWAFTELAALPGLLMVGRERVALAACSALSLLFSAAVLVLDLQVQWLAYGSFAAQLMLLLAAMRLVRNLPLSNGQLPSTSRSEGLGLLLLTAAGFCNGNTDVLLASNFLSAAEQVPYAMVSRGLMAAVVLTGMWAQLRFPVWCSRNKLDASLGELRRAMWAVLLILLVAMLVLVLSREVTGANSGLLSLLAPSTLAAMALASLLACLTAGWGQVLLAHDAGRSFLWPCAALAFAAPVLALAMGRSLGIVGLICGYAASNLAVAGVLALRTRELKVRQQ